MDSLKVLSEDHRATCLECGAKFTSADFPKWSALKDAYRHHVLGTGHAVTVVRRTNLTREDQ